MKCNKLYEIKDLFVTQLFPVYSLAIESYNEDIFKENLLSYLCSNHKLNADAVRNIQNLIENDGRVLCEFSTGEKLKCETISLLWHFLNGRDLALKGEPDMWMDLYHQFLALYIEVGKKPSLTEVHRWMDRWPSGLDRQVVEARKKNKERIIRLLVKKIENRHPLNSRYVFPRDCSEEQKTALIKQWWKEERFQLAMAVKSPEELNRFLDHSLSEETLYLYSVARKKGMPIFVTPYYLSLLDSSNQTYDDAAIRSYIFYSPHLVETFGHIRAWEKEDVVEAGKPNAAGWILPEGHNIHRRYPEVAIMIPDTMGRACGGLCASCQRMYDFQSKRLNFEFEALHPKESWGKRLNDLMDYFENDRQLRDILITGGDALMNRNKTLKHILEAVLKMAVRKRKANSLRSDGEKYAELQRVRLGSRIPVYLPMRINDELIEVLRDFKKAASKVGVEQFVIQTHFQSPLELTEESYEAVQKLLGAGWIVCNQMVYNVAASRRGHAAKLRKVLNDAGVLCYYTFSVKGFDENYDVFTPNSRSIQEQMEEKSVGLLDEDKEREFMELLRLSSDPKETVHHFCSDHKIPFVATDRNVLNLPGIGKSMTFKMIGITSEGKRILRFQHDANRRHSPVIHQMNDIDIKENKSIMQYMLQLQQMGENPDEYAELWYYTKGKTEKRFPLYEYPKPEFSITKEYSNMEIKTESLEKKIMSF